MMKKDIPFAEHNIWSMWIGSMLSLHSRDRFIGRLEQEATSQIIHGAWYFTYVSYVFGQGCASLSVLILLDSSPEILLSHSRILWQARFVNAAFMKLSCFDTG